ncbi:MAG: TonB-dependent receptor [Bacteroidia bacterium]|nr:TonB-dependent receptor [Bacteroidia bacterium]
MHLLFRTSSVFLFVALLSFEGIFAQSLTGSLRGTVKNRHTEIPLPGIQVKVLKTTETIFETLTESDGTFLITGIPVGRHEVEFIAEGYKNQIRPGVLIVSAKQTDLQVLLEENFYQLDAVVLVPEREKGRAWNDMASVSALSFEVEETRKFAGGLDDPARLAGNLPGVVATPFISENGISVRGNSPIGMLYRLEGVDIPNPNHFARIGGSSGTFTIFSNQLLANSDFFTGAFPAEYGNATAGVFDIRFRNGNFHKREFALQAGVLGVDLAAEGPLAKGKKASYLVNYRYSSLGFANLLINYLSLPTYQDISFKIHLPTQSAGTFDVFGIGGVSKRLRYAEEDTSLWEENLDRFELLLTSDMAALGASHTLLLGSKSVLKSVVVGSYNDMKDNKKYLDESLGFFQREKNEFRQQPITLTSSLTHQFTPRITTKTGVIFTTAYNDYVSLKYDYVENFLFTRAKESGRTQKLQGYSQTQLRLNSKFTANLGLHFLYFDLNDRASLEPRAGIIFQPKPRHSISAGYGLHSRVESFPTYMTRLHETDDSLSRPNLNLDFIKTHHLVLGYQAMLTDYLKVRVEAYYQYLYNVPVEVNGYYSVVNINELNELRVLDNLGTSTNKGIDFGLERFTKKGAYFLLNGSIFDSKYTDAQGVTRSTAFDIGHKVNLLAGKEFRVGKKKGYNNTLGFNGTLSAYGGQRYTPIDLISSAAYRETVYDESRSYELQETPLYIFDFTFTYKINRPRYTGTWAVQIKNLFSSSVPEYREYDDLLGQEVTLEGASVLPVMSYKIEF